MRPLATCARAAVLLVLVFLVVGCGGSPASSFPTGAALDPGYAMLYGLAPLKPGTQLGLLDVDLLNRGNAAITLDSVSGIGRGLGTTIKVVEVKIAPSEAGNKGTTGGAFEVDPPVYFWKPTNSCGRQVLLRLRGFRLAAGALARVWIVIQAARPGRFSVGTHLIRYSVNGTEYQQPIPTGYKGTVSRKAPFLPIDPSEARCIKSMHPRLLRGQFVHKP
jgi:hypothetical protein